MFKQVVLRRSTTALGDLDEGLLAETLLFYEDVLLLLDRGSLAALLKALGHEIILRLISEHGVKISYLREGFAVHSRWEGAVNLHDLAEITFRATPEGKRLDAKGEVAEIIERTLGKSRQTRRAIRKLVDHISIHRLNATETLGRTIADLARDDLDDQKSVQDGVEIALRHLLPGYSPPFEWHLRIIKLDGPFVIDTNLDFHTLSKMYNQRIPATHSSITGPYLISQLYEARADAFLASKYMSAYVSNPISCDVMKARYTDLIRKRNRDAAELDLFQEIHLQGRSIRRVINAGERSFAEMLIILDTARRFKTWLAERNPDEELQGEYHKAVTAETWIDRLPSKALRWLGTTGLGAAVEALYPSGAAIAAAQGISALDAILLDKILKGWRPDQFVEGELASFVGASN